MSFVGRLEHFSLPDLLQFLAGSGKTGTLTLTLRFDEGLLVLRQGRIIYAASTCSRQTLGSVLVSRGVISERELGAALEKMLDSSREKRLGTILVDSGVLDREILEQVLREQIASVLHDFMSWDDAVFRFEPLSIPDHGEVEVDAKDLLLEHGLAAEQVLLDLMQVESESLDESVDNLVDETPEEERPVASLWSIMSEIQPPEFTGEITLQILEEARKHFQRIALYGVYHDRFEGMTRFGVPAASQAASLRLARERGSLLDRIVDSRRAYLGALPDDAASRELVEGLGGGSPLEVVAIPMIVGGRVIAVFYADGGPLGGRLPGTEAMEIQLAESSLAMERAALEKRLRNLERLRRQRTRA